MLPSEIPKLPTDPPERGFPAVWKLLLLHDRSPSLTLLSLSLSFIFGPTSFRREWAAFLGAWCPLPVFRSCFMEVAQHSNDLLMNLWEKKWSPHPFLSRALGSITMNKASGGDGISVELFQILKDDAVKVL